MTREELQTIRDACGGHFMASNGQLSRSQLKCSRVANYLLNRSLPKQ
jgi:hypothetical protein